VATATLKSIISTNTETAIRNDLQDLGLLPNLSNLGALCLLAVARANGFELARWLDGRGSADTWSRKISCIQSTPFASAHIALDKWSKDSKQRGLSFLDKHLASAVDLFAELRLACEPEEGIKRQGAVFTPRWLASRITQNALIQWKKLHRTGKEPATIADPACGTGIFLAEVRNVFGDKPDLLGFDVDPLSAVLANLLGLTIKKKWSTICCDPLVGASTSPTLFSPEQSLPRAQFDIIIGNPPYVRSQVLDREYAKLLRQLFPDLTSGNFDLSILFLEYAFRALNPGGLVSFVTTSKFMNSTYGRSICRKLAAGARIVNVEDFHDAQVFPGRTTYTCILTFAKLPPAERFSVTRFPGGVVGEQDPGPGESETLPHKRLEHHPWDFTGGSVQNVLSKLRSEEHLLFLSLFDDILQGIRTGANQVFVLSPEESDALESDILLPFVSGEDIRRCQIVSTNSRLIFPYERDSFGKFNVLTEAKLRSRFPKTSEHFERHRQVLEDRQKDANTPWYAFSRPQNLELAFTPKLLVREMMPRAEFAADYAGEVAFCAGYALPASKLSRRDLALWTAVLSTPTLEFALRHNGTQLHSGWFRLLKHHLQRTRLPRLNSQSKVEAEKLALRLQEDPTDTKTWKRLDDIVADRYELTDGERDVIKEFLSDCHRRSCPNASSDGGLADAELPKKANANYEPVTLSRYELLHRERGDLARAVTFQINKKTPIHNWFPFTQGFSAPLIESLLNELQVRPGQIVFDPFVGSGTTQVVCKQKGIASIGIETSPLLSWVTRSKLRAWQPSELSKALDKIEKCKVPDVKPNGLLFQDYLSTAFAPQILGQLLGLVRIASRDSFPQHIQDFLKMGIIGIMEAVSQIRKHGSHYRFMLKTESIGLQKLNIPIINPTTDIVPIYIQRLRQMLQDVRLCPMPRPAPHSEVKNGDARSIDLSESSADVIVTSPPYLNRNNYIAQQKAEISLLGLLRDYSEYRELVRSTIRSHVEFRFGAHPSSRFKEVESIVELISLSPGNNPKIPYMVAGYFEDMNDVLKELFRVLVPGGRCAFVVGNSRWGGVVVPVDHLILMIAETHGFVPEKILVTRLKGNSPQQMRRFGRIPVRESIVIFRKPKRS
jgi:tRNA G10  N-methylase Trm11